MSVHITEYNFLLQICGRDVLVDHTWPLLYLSLANIKIYHHCITTQDISVTHNAKNLANKIEEVANMYVNGENTD